MRLRIISLCFTGPPVPNNGKDALNTPETLPACNCEFARRGREFARCGRESIRSVADSHLRCARRRVGLDTRQ
eukprot:4242904-Pyramimonas_sp.AAC.2